MSESCLGQSKRLDQGVGYAVPQHDTFQYYPANPARCPVAFGGGRVPCGLGVVFYSLFVYQSAW